MEILTALLGAGVGAGLMAIIKDYLNRKWAKEDKEDTRIDALVRAEKIMMIDRVTWLGKEYISHGEIALTDKENLIEMHEAYKSLGGNGHLDTVMNEIKKLKVVGE